MRIRAGLGALVLALGALAACGDGDDTSAPQDGGSAETVSKADFVSAADEACARAADRIDELGDVEGDLASSDLSPSQLEDAAQHTEQLVAIYDDLVRDLDDMAQPDDSSDADDANKVVDDLGTALEHLRRVVRAAETGDASALPTAWADYAAAYQTYAAAAQSFGLADCGRPA